MSVIKQLLQLGVQLLFILERSGLPSVKRALRPIKDSVKLRLSRVENCGKAVLMCRVKEDLEPT
jgi:hypothetical protein